MNEILMKKNKIHRIRRKAENEQCKQKNEYK